MARLSPRMKARSTSAGSNGSCFGHSDKEVNSIRTSRRLDSIDHRVFERAAFSLIAWLKIVIISMRYPWVESDLLFASNVFKPYMICKASPLTCRETPRSAVEILGFFALRDGVASWSTLMTSVDTRLS